MLTLVLLLAGCRTDFKPVTDTGGLGTEDDTGDAVGTPTDTDPGETADPTDDTGEVIDDTGGETGDPVVDDDGDGFSADEDCDDGNSEIHPDAQELCDGVDNDCDLLVDSQDDDVEGESTWLADLDGDGYGDDDSAVESCDGPSGYTEVGGDCDDTNAEVNPGAPEVCNELDDDCDGLVDDDDDSVTGTTTWYLDSDGDGVGSDAYAVDACTAVGFAETDGDCDDTDATIYPGANEICDGLDNDCDGDEDEAGAEGESTWYADADGDGWGDADTSSTSCEGATGYVDDASDCDDGDAEVNPAADEVCDEVDNDCDGLVDDADDDVTDATTWYADSDGDGYGDADTSVTTCAAASGWVSDTSDCDDANADVNPSAEEICNELDDDCDLLVDDDDPDLADAATWYLDYDGDDYGTESYSTESCDAPTGYVGVLGDCDDTDAESSPEAEELCDGVDNDCDGDTDEDATDTSTFYADADGDGFGDPGSTEDSCEAPTGYGTDATDCDDADASVNPDAAETCDDIDNDCDGLVDDDDDVSGTTTWYADSDGDGFGDAATDACDMPSAHVSEDGDCDDGDATVNPDADEVCDSIDNDCDGLVDDDDDSLTDGVTSYLDYDGDGYGASASSSYSCDTPSGYVSDDTDCDDADDGVHPDADETCDEVDEDCDGAVDEDAADVSTWYADADGDGYGDAADSSEACDAPSGSVDNDDDCDDTDASVSPDTSWYIDYDGDGYGSSAYTTTSCEQPSGYVDNDEDCDDADEAVTPDLAWYTDDDCDGYGDDGSEVNSCEQPSGTLETGGDCDDADSTSSPSGVELCDSADNDCDGTVDEDCEDPILLGSPSAEDPGEPTTAAACAMIGETTNTGYDPHYSSNLDSYMEMFAGSVSGLTDFTVEDADVLDYSARCGSDYAASPGNFSSTTSWPTLGTAGSYGLARFRGYLRIGCEEELNRTIGLIGNDSLSLTIEGEEVAAVNWSDGQWKKFRYVSFPEPGLYAFEVKWSTNLVCDIDPFELVWAEGFVDGYDDYDTMCASSSCDYGNGVEIPGFAVVEGSSLAQATDGGSTDCLQCESDSDCDASESCNSAGICE